jgi:hypothetical protein
MSWIKKHPSYNPVVRVSKDAETRTDLEINFNLHESYVFHHLSCARLSAGEARGHFHKQNDGARIARPERTVCPGCSFASPQNDNMGPLGLDSEHLDHALRTYVAQCGNRREGKI